MQGRSPAELYALLLGLGLVAAGMVGFFYNGTFSSNQAVHDDVFGIFSVNGWHNVLHIATGAIGLAVASSWAASRGYAFGIGVLYIGVAIWGFIVGSGDSILSIVPINTADNVLHLLIGIAGMGAGAATPSARTPAGTPAITT